METITREQWGAAPPTGVLYPWGLGTPIGGVVHWIGVPDLDVNGDQEYWSRKLRGIQRYEQTQQNYTDIAYSMLFDPQGRIYEGRGWNWRSGANGSSQYNRSHLSFCYCAGPGVPLTAAAKTALSKLDAEARRRFATYRELTTHRRVRPSPTACPGAELGYYVEEEFKPGVPSEPVPPVSWRTANVSDLKSSLVNISLDANGNGWRSVNPGFGRAPVVVATSLHGPYPPVDGYWFDGSAPLTTAQVRGNEVVVTVQNGKPNSVVGVWVVAA